VPQTFKVSENWPQIIHGKKAQTALLFLHGFWGSALDWDFIQTGLADNWYSFALDLPGHGANTSSVTTIPETANRIADWMQLQAVEKWILIGYSLGGRLAQALALKQIQKIQALVLLSTSAGLKTQAERAARQSWEIAWVKKFEQETPSELLAQWHAQSLFGALSSHPNYPALKLRRLENSGKKLAEVMIKMGTSAQPSFWPKLAQFQFPSLYLCGEKDASYVKLGREICLALPQAQQVIIPGVSHALLTEAPEIILSEIRLFLNNVSGSV
jgi:2-succinyl-6-hydroxy-2,4-cyclohexadiene-1-carboxylate synthase